MEPRDSFCSTEVKVEIEDEEITIENERIMEDTGAYNTNFKETSSDDDISPIQIQSKRDCDKALMRPSVEEKSYICCYCKKAFCRISNLNVHQSRCHSDDKPSYACNTCQKSYKYKSDLRRHILIHFGTKKFKCKFCTKSFNRNEHLKNHSSTHLSNKPFQCSKCDKSFAKKNSLTNHEFAHPGDKLICEKCLQSFPSKRDMAIHWYKNVRKGSTVHVI